MTVIEMTHSFLNKAKSLDRTDVANLKTFEILRLLNDSQQIVIDEVISSGNLGALHNITSSTSIASASFASYDNTPGGGIAVDLGVITGFRNYVRSSSNMTRTQVPVVSSAKNTNNEEINSSNVGLFETNGSNLPIFINPKCFLDGDYLLVIADGYTTISSVDVTYIKYPGTMVMSGAGSGEVTTCELPVFLHEKVVDIALIKSSETINVNDIKNDRSRNAS